ncbi:MAG: ABC transporter ATP-binding protein, partial [Planctomycetota bacterium]
MNDAKPYIEVQELHRYFGDVRAVSGVSFAVYPGQVFGFIGPNGAGKTTTMRILATLDLPTLGEGFIDGFSVVDDPEHARRRLGFMPDYLSVYHGMAVWEYLDFFARAYDLSPGDRRRRLAEVMAFTGLDALAEKPVTGLSKGMKQRLSLGRILVHDPPALILDEPASGLDPRARVELRDMIRQLAHQGKAVLISSHILSELAEICDVVGIIELGRMIAVGPVDQIQRQLAENRNQELTELRIEPVDRVEELAAWLAGKPGVR